jgi:hypothetical protein
MVETARQLITDAFFLSGVISRDLQSISGAEIEAGLTQLNDILAVKRVDLDHIPYYELKTFNTVGGVEKYFVENMLKASTITFNLQTVRFSTSDRGRDDYFGSSRIDTLQTLPVSCHVERVFDGIDVYFYPIPDKAYPIKIFGKVWMDEVSLNDDLSTFFDRFYLVYLKYKLASYLCNTYGNTFPPQKQKELDSLEQMTADVSAKDMNIKKLSPFGKGRGVNWGIVNLWKGIS